MSSQNCEKTSVSEFKNNLSTLQFYLNATLRCSFVLQNQQSQRRIQMIHKSVICVLKKNLLIFNLTWI